MEAIVGESATKTSATALTQGRPSGRRRPLVLFAVLALGAVILPASLHLGKTGDLLARAAHLASSN